MHQFVLKHKHLYQAQTGDLSKMKEVFVGDVIQVAVHTDIKIEKVIFEGSEYIDIGTPDDLAKAVLRGFRQQEEIK